MDRRLVTINEQLKQTAGQIREASNVVPIPTPPVPKRPRFRYLIPLIVLTAVVATIVPSVWPGLPTQTAAERTADNVDMVRTWVGGALDGDFDRIAGLTHGEHGEPDALAALAKTIHRDRGRYGDPSVRIWPFETDNSSLDFVCLSVEFRDDTIVGGFVLRSWTGLGKRLWEFRPVMEGCTNGQGETDNG